MHKRVRRKKIYKTILYVCLISLFIGMLFMLYKNDHTFITSNHIEHLSVIDDGIVRNFYNIQETTVGDFLLNYDDTLSENTLVFPPRDKHLFSDDVLTIERAKTITISADDATRQITTYRNTIEDTLRQNDILLDANDIVTPPKSTIITENITIDIIRVIFKEETITKKIPFKKIEKTDETLNFLKKITEQKGVNGVKEIIYKVAYHNNKEVNRTVSQENITKEPVDEIIVQGTKVVVGKKHTGACSWYAHTGTLSAANPWMPIGSYARVTNQENGKSVIVQINDRGPFVASRIIDLDKVAFEEIASLGSGVINVKMEEIIND